MFFTQVGRFVAFLALGTGVLGMIMAYGIPFLDPSTVQETFGERGFNARSFIVQSRMWIAFGIVLGILTEISKSIAAIIHETGKNREADGSE